jgi:NADH-quinone oxidoreductase subunit M
MTENLLLVVILLPLLGCLFAAFSRVETAISAHNAVNVALWVIVCNILLILLLFTQINISDDGFQFIHKFTWLIIPQATVIFGTDVVALTLLLGIHLAFLIGILGIRQKAKKTEIAFSLMLLFAFCGFCSALDLFSFYTFFVLLLPPLFMQIGLNGKNQTASRFFMYNFIGSVLLLLPVVMLYAYENSNIPIYGISEIHIDSRYGVLIWSSIFLAFMFRIPVWPFHYWISSVNTGLRNSLTFICASILPVSGLLGFMRFWPAEIPEQISSLAPLFEVLCVLTMLYLAFVGYSSLKLHDKLFSYIFIYYLLYLLGIFAPTTILQRNLAYSLFAFLLVFAALSVLVFHIEEQGEKNAGSPEGILCLLPKTSLAYGALLLAAIGFPVSALFWNNFIIVSQILTANIYIGTAAVFTILLAAVFLLQNLYGLKDKSCLAEADVKVSDIDNIQFFATVVVLVILLLSFIKPLWFVF